MTRATSPRERSTTTRYGAAVIDDVMDAAETGVDATSRPASLWASRRWRWGATTVAIAIAVIGTAAIAPARLLGARKVRVEVAVDVGCIPKRVMENFIPAFFEHDVIGVDLLPRGHAPCEFGGHSRRCRRIPLVQEGFSTVFKKVVRLTPGEEYGFAIVNAVGERIFELGRNERYRRQHEQVLTNGTCVTNVHRGGGVYRNRVLPRLSHMQKNAQGAHQLSTVWGDCLEKCPLTVKLIATVAPGTGTADNVYGIEESKAALDVWRSYKGHFVMVSSGEYVTWGLDSNTGQLAWSKNADLNPYSAANWNYVNNNAAADGTTYGSVVDFDVGYQKVYAVTSTIDVAGGKVWQRPVGGNGDWSPSGHTGSRLVQTTTGRTMLWGTNKVGDLWRCTDPCGPHDNWSHESQMGTNTKQVEVGDSDAFVVWKDNVSLYRKQENGGGAWTKISLPSTLTNVNQVAVGATALWILAQSGQLFTCELPCAGGDAIKLVANAPANIISIDAGKVIHP